MLYLFRSSQWDVKKTITSFVINEMITGLGITMELVVTLSSLLDCFLLNSTDQKIIYVLFIFIYVELSFWSVVTFLS